MTDRGDERLKKITILNIESGITKSLGYDDIINEYMNIITLKLAKKKKKNNNKEFALVPYTI